MTRQVARLARVAATLAVLATGVLASGCATRHPAPISPQALQDAQLFPYFPVYWAGLTFDHHTVTAVDGRKGYIPSLGDSVEYGDCDPGKGILHTGGCVLPLQVTTVIWSPHCNASLGAQHNILIRGVPATVFDGGDSIEIYTGRVAVDVYGDNPAATLRAAGAVRPLNTRGSATGPLPAPTYRPGLVAPAPHYRVAPSVPIAERKAAALARQAAPQLKQLLILQSQGVPINRRYLAAVKNAVEAAKPLKC